MARLSDQQRKAMFARTRNRSTRQTEHGTRVDEKSGAVINPDDSLFGRGRFVKLKSGQDVFLPNELSVKQQKVAVNLVNKDINPNQKFDATEVRLIAPVVLTAKQKQSQKIIINGKEAVELIGRAKKRFGDIPAFNVGKVVKPIG